MPRPLALLVVVAAVACARPPIAPPPHPPARIAIVAPDNRTGDQLVVSGRWDVAMLLGRPVVTAPDVLARDLAAVLAARGFAVAPDDGDAAELRVTLRRFVPDTPRGEFVDVDLDATLQAPGDGAVLWRLHRDRWIVPTRGAPTVADALGLAARAVAEALVGDWTPTALSSPAAR
ncbi:MAG: hypothetical protein KIT14_09530 [bacterium]|nr:hypothetical protein [bacterium]